MRSSIKMDQQRSHDVSSELETVIKNIPQKNLPEPWIALQNFLLNYLKIPRYIKINRQPLSVLTTISTKEMEIVTVETPQHYGRFPYSESKGQDQAAEAAIAKIHENRLFLNELIQLSHSMLDSTAMSSWPFSLQKSVGITSNLPVEANHQAATKSYLEKNIACAMKYMPTENSRNPTVGLIKFCKHQLNFDVDFVSVRDDAERYTVRVFFGLDLLSECRSHICKAAEEHAATEALMQLNGKKFSWMTDAVAQDVEEAEMGTFYINRNGEYVIKQNEKVHTDKFLDDRLKEVIRAMEAYEDAKKSLLNGRQINGSIYIRAANKLCQLTEHTNHPLEDRKNELLRMYFLKGLCIGGNLLEPDFDLASMSEESSPKSGAIECRCEEVGLAYRVRGIDGTVNEGLKPWTVEFPQQSIDEIIRNKAKWLPVILAFTSEKGHTTSEISDKLKVHIYPFSSRVTQLLDLMFNKKNIPLEPLAFPIVGRANFNRMLDVVIKSAYSIIFAAQKDRSNSQRGEILAKFFESPLFDNNLIKEGGGETPCIFKFFSRNSSAKSAPTVDAALTHEFKPC